MFEYCSKLYVGWQNFCVNTIESVTICDGVYRSVRMCNERGVKNVRTRQHIVRDRVKVSRMCLQMKLAERREPGGMATIHNPPPAEQ